MVSDVPSNLGIWTKVSLETVVRYYVLCDVCFFCLFSVKKTAFSVINKIEFFVLGVGQRGRG